jgi:phospholipase C
MGYYGAEEVPVYDHLARHYCVCDAWHSSVPGDTWPNRLYALSGREAPSVGHRPGLWSRLLAYLRGFPLAEALADAPIFETEAFTRHLDDSQWRWYSHDPATLRAADERYRNPLVRDNFTYFDRKRVNLITELGEAAITTRDSFLDDAAKGELRDVSWIDPNFIDLSVLDPNSEDDHPPSDIRAGQEFVLGAYEALQRCPQWEDTLLVIVNDEHGGFFDHVPPPPTREGDESGYRSLGVRVPALLVGPRARKFVCHEIFEHTSLIATILRRFAPDPEAALAAMPPRVRAAPHLGVALADEPRTYIPGCEEARTRLERWRSTDKASRRALEREPSLARDGVGRAMELHDFQESFLRFSLAMRERGLPPGQP